MIVALALILALAAPAAALAAPAAAVAAPADLVVVNAKVITVETRGAEAAAIRDGRFVLVGSNVEARALVGPKTRVLDARGKSVVPGLIDTHVHALDVAAEEAVQPFRQLDSIADLQEWVRQRAKTAPTQIWIRVPRVDLTRFRERRVPTRAELDAANSTRPVVFTWGFPGSTQIHMLNSAALKAAGITRDTPAPAGGSIAKDAAGEPTGELRNAAKLVDRFLAAPSVSSETILDKLAEVHRRYNEVGITSVSERLSDPEGFRTYQKLAAAGRLTVRANVTLELKSDGTVEGTERVIRALPVKWGEGDDWVRVGPLKFLVDGGVLYGSAYMREPYGPAAARLYAATKPAHRGALIVPADKLKNMILAGHRLGWQMSTHATGDGSVDLVLDAVEAAHASLPITKRRFTLIHAYFPNREALRRAAALGVVVDTQPAWYYKDGDAIVDPLGAERMSRFVGLAEWQRAGIKTAINTDHMYGLDPVKSLNPFSPFLTMYVAVTRKTESGRVMGPEQRISRQDALRMMTTDAAFLSFDETKKGSIAVGKLGDLAILTDDFAACPADRIKDLRVAATVVGGRVVYERK